MKTIARNLRYHQTPSERLLWRHLRNSQLQGLKFLRQHPIPPYVVDFCCMEYRVIIEIDGLVHNEGNIPHQDARRQQDLEEQGYTFLRFTSEEVMKNLEGVLTAIMLGLPSPYPLPEGNLSRKCFLGRWRQGLRGIFAIKRTETYVRSKNHSNTQYTLVREYLRDKFGRGSIDWYPS